ncbi:unnamed protein product [Linum tenue]|uniref:Uncharacterized protein n=1 Tax=Linum tenue TaxID=586396 RepID=A0AAV0LSQ7_9ROSI|nr:unnamed protein product [Linum tenue]
MDCRRGQVADRVCQTARRRTMELCLQAYRAEEEWEELQIEVGELLEARPQERPHHPTGRDHYCGVAC